MNICTTIITLTLLSFSVWIHFSAAFPSRHRRPRQSKQSGLYANGIVFDESLHFINSAFDPNSPHLVPDDSGNGDAEYDNIVNFDSDNADFEGSTFTPSTENSQNGSHLDDHGIHIASWQWDFVKTPFIYTAVITVAGFCKIGFHHAKFLSSILPESCVLILLGTIVGTVVHFTGSTEMLPQFTPRAFYLFLSPPILLESAYSLYDRAFFSNFGTIILYAVMGTIMNFSVIGFSLYGLMYVGALGDIQLQLIECFLFSSLISAVDPVAVLAIFKEVGVNKNLYFLVLGESLINDAVTIEIYMTMVNISFAGYLTGDQMAVGIFGSICASLGGLSIGIIMGIFTALITKHTQEVRVVEPLTMLGMAYLSSLLADMVDFCGIISLITCGIVQAHYASKNISSKSNITVKYFSKMVSAVCDTMLFLFLGMVLVDQHEWQTGFVLWATLLCFIIRFASVFFLTYCANNLERTHRINEDEQFIMAYGGLRGAVAFSLVMMLDHIEHKNLFTTATLFIILFTVFIQGATFKPLVNLLKIRRQASKDTSRLFTEVNKKLLDHVMEGVEEVAGDDGGYYWKQLLSHYNRKYLQKWLLCKNTERSLNYVCTRMMLEEHFIHLYGPVAAIEDHIPLLINKVSSDELNDVLEDTEEEDLRQRKLQEEELRSDDDLMPKRRGTKFNFLEGVKGRLFKDKRKQNSDTTALLNRSALLKQQITLTMFNKTQEDDSSRLLQKALLHNPYNKLHHKYYPSLVNDEDQEISAQLKKRRLRTRMLALLAMRSKSIGTTERRAYTPQEEEATLSGPLFPLAASFFLERAQKRRGLAKDLLASKSVESVTTLKPESLDKQRAVSGTKTLGGTNDIATIGEEGETEIVIDDESTKDCLEEKRKNSEESEV